MTANLVIDYFDYNYFFIIGGLFLSYIIYKLLHSVLSGNNYIQTKYKLHGHTWRSIQCNKSIPYSIHCTVCGKLMLPLVGLFCECCAVSACKRCHHTVDKKLRCKPMTWPSGKPFHHHWVHIGTSLCDSETDHREESLKKFFCAWCQRTKTCRDSAFNDSEQCDFQKYKKIIIPPACVQMEKGEVTGIVPLPDDDWEPLIVFANRKSGGNKSDEVLSLLRGVLNPVQVIDLSVTSPASAVRWVPERCRVLAAGGDGTVAWVADAVASQPRLRRVPIAILPMGTGNDLSRVLGWGPTCSSHLDAHQIIDNVLKGQEQPLDRWKITIRPRRSRLGRARPERVVHAYNYASVGVDAQVALDFHRARSQFLYRYANRSLNYMAYLFLGAGRALDCGGCGGLERRVRVRADAAALPLPPLQSLLVINIPSWGAGLDLWSMGDENEVEPQSITDGKFEVVGISSSFHIARLQCGLAEPYRFTQASKLKLELSGSCAMQVDGEPWMQSAATITVEHAGQALFLRAVN